MTFDKYKKNGAYHYQWYKDPNWVWYKECVDRAVDFCQGSTIDAGCGDGFVAKKIQENGYNVLGLDNEISGLQICNDNRIPFFNHDLEKSLPFDNHFDYLCCLNTIEHLKTLGGIKYLINNNVTKGAVIITDLATENKGRYHECEYSGEDLVKAFEEFRPKYFEIHSTEFGKPITFIGVEIRK